MPKINKENITLTGWCKKNNYPGVTRECVVSAFQSDNPEVVKLAKREKIKGMVENGRN